MKNSLDFKNIFKRETKLASYIVICLTIVVISLSYAMFFQVDKNSKNQEVVAGDFTFTYTDGSTITSTGNTACFIPMNLDETGLYLESCGYRFSVRNAGTLKATYTLRLTQNEENNVESSKLKVILRKKVGDVYEVVDSYPKVVSEITDGVLVTDEIDEKTTIEYNIQIFVEESSHIDADASKVVSYQIEGSGVVHESQPINSEVVDTKNMMVVMDIEEQCFTYKENGDCLDTVPLVNRTYTQGDKYNTKITDLVFESSLNPHETVEEVVDFSEAKDRSVLGYYVSNGDDTYTLYVQADGKIKANPDAYGYFFVNSMEMDTPDGTIPLPYGVRLAGIENIDTSFVTNMKGMFYLVMNDTLNLQSFNTSNVTNMEYMFYGCKNLTNLDLSGFDTSKVTDMSYMFVWAIDLGSINYGDNFIYKNGAIVTNMFDNCSANKPMHESWNGVTF